MQRQFGIILLDCIGYAILLNPEAAANDPEYTRICNEKCLEIYGGKPNAIDPNTYKKYKDYIDALENPEISANALAAGHRIKHLYKIDWNISDYGFEQDSHLAQMNKHVMQLVNRLTVPASKRIGLNSDELKHRLTRVEMINDSKVRGLTRSSDGWKSFEIILHWGLMQLCHRMIKVLVSRLGIISDDKRTIIEETPVSWKDTTTIASDLMRGFWQRDFEPRQKINIVDLSDAQIEVSGSLLYNAELFIVAHEFGHVVANLSPHNLNETSRGVDTIAQFLTKIPKLDLQQRNELAKLWGREICADLVGLQLMLSLQDENGSNAIMAYVGAQIFFVILNMLETFHLREFGKSVEYTTHPPSHWRLAAIRSASPDEAREFGEAFEAVADGIVASK